MNKLPSELLNAIFLLLHQQDKVELMTVCQKWKLEIENHSLFHTVRVRSMIQMYDLTKKVQKQPILGTKVERLIIDLNLNNFEMDVLTELFPNVKQFFDFETYSRNRIPFTENSGLPHLWNKHIENITECYDNLNIYQILKSGLCPHLTNLSTFGMSRFHDSNFVELLANAPALMTLTLHSCRFDLFDLETLHNNVPHLRSFACHFLFVSCETMPPDIMPTTSLNTLFLTLVRMNTIEDEIHLFQYFHKKYPNLSQLCYGSNTLERTETEVQRLYDNELASFLKGIGPKLQSFSFDWEYEDPNLYTLLDNAGCQIKEHTLNTTPTSRYKINHLATSDQSRFITSLTVNNTFDRADLESLTSLTSLTELNFDLFFQINQSQRELIDLSEMMGVLGATLKTLTVSNAQLTFDMSAITPCALQHLYMTQTSLPYNIDQFFSQSFPKLQKLKMKHCEWHHQGPFVMSNIDLLRFEFMERFPEESKLLVIETAHTKRWYKARTLHNAAYTLTKTDTSDHLLYPAMVSVPFETWHAKPFMTFVFKSLHTFRMVNGSD